MINTVELTVKEKEELLNELTQDLYSQHRAFQPRPPWVLVRTLSREQKTKSGLFLPAIDQNKTVHEGVVLAVWKPYSTERVLNSNMYEKKTHTSALKVGDHVLFPHWAGLPVSGMPEDNYRIIRETDYEHNGGVWATVVYSSVEERESVSLDDILSQYYKAKLDTDTLDNLREDILDRFLLVDRDANSVTISGR